jgi:hypothetical protein
MSRYFFDRLLRHGFAARCEAMALPRRSVLALASGWALGRALPQNRWHVEV